MKAPGTPLSAEPQGLSGRLSSASTHPIGDLNGGDLRPSLSRLSSQFDGSSLNFNGLQAAGLEDGLHVGPLRLGLDTTTNGIVEIVCCRPSL